MSHTPFPSKAAAYDMARKEFYAVRRKQEVDQRVAREEALAVGAIFGPSALEFGMHLEDRAWDKFRRNAGKHLDTQESQRISAAQGMGGDSEAEEDSTSENLLGAGQETPQTDELQQEAVPVGRQKLGAFA